jgi:hypothetical protein
VSYDNALYLWREGERRFLELPPDLAPIADRVVAGVVAELRRRLGGRFSSTELAELYGRGTTWCLELATRVAPDEPRVWETPLAADAAFARYQREAVDYAGARRDTR